LLPLLRQRSRSEFGDVPWTNADRMGVLNLSARLSIISPIYDGKEPAMSRKQKRRSGKESASDLPRRLEERLDEVHQLVNRGQLIQARQQLEELDRKYPDTKEVLHFLTNVDHDLRDYLAYQGTCERLLAIRPNSAAFTLMLAGAYLLNRTPALSLRA